MGLIHRIWPRGADTETDARAPLKQAGAIPFTQVGPHITFLLVTSRRTGRWIFPKGALEDGVEPWQTARQEAFEEAGVEGEIETAPLGLYRSIKTRGLRRYPIEIAMYALRLTNQHEDWPEKSQRHRHWVLLPEARRLLSDQSLAEMAERIDRRETTS